MSTADKVSIGLAFTIMAGTAIILILGAWANLYIYLRKKYHSYISAILAALILVLAGLGIFYSLYYVGELIIYLGIVDTPKK